MAVGSGVKAWTLASQVIQYGLKAAYASIFNMIFLLFSNDIAMIKLASPVVLNNKVQPSCVPESGEVAPHDDPCYITGWGRIYSGSPLASKLQQALLPMVGHSVCSSSGWWGGTVKTTMICGGGDIHSGCHGDSDPLNCRGRDGRWYVQGVTSFVSSRGCNTLMKPTVFTHTSSFTKWISDTMLQY
ncbi:chymotrypsin-like elastase family member 3B [Gymnodraco acuticeps]|uniref:Chymotrypsin-like elastase family member 3B n=1 Tax=Gymnodraco acuticeps TaxID=8218 RepID=A0A6P8X0H0_GYMAC|nr:chymotrypsin-like elastase family member 3B [Gymnodraco acuticeps]